MPAAVSSHRRLRARGCRTGYWTRGDAREAGITPMSWRMVPPSPLRPQPPAWELPHLLADEVSCRIVSALQSPAEPNLLAPVTCAGFCWFCSFLSQNPKVTARFFQMRLWGRVLAGCRWFPVVPERARLGNVLNSWKPPLFSPENRENIIFIS